MNDTKFPDPTDFGWTFTGSCPGGRVEFFEKHCPIHDGIVKLDFYYTTGTVKTVLDHPKQGVTQLFAQGKSLSPDLYRLILQNPRQHTGIRYRRRRRRKPRGISPQYQEQQDAARQSSSKEKG